ncbi:MAG: hypothetical protein WAN12_15770 [Candidatus Acidiferrum sp.]
MEAYETREASVVGEGDHVSNGCWNSGGKADDAFAMRPEARRVGLWSRTATIQHRIAKWEVGSGERVKPAGAGISGRSGEGKERLKEAV